jgi:putative intracellular protease/amidase
MRIYDLIIFLPKEKFTSHNVKILLNKLLKTGISYRIIGKDNICESYSGDLFQCLSVKEAIKESIYGKSLFLPGGEGVLDLINDTLALSYLNTFDLTKNYLFLENEAILVFIFLRKLFGKTITKFTKNKSFYFENQLTPLDEDVVIDSNLITTRKIVSEEFVKKIMEKLEEIKNK